MTYWGKELQVDLTECNAMFIRDRAIIAKFLTQICDLIDMKRYGDPVIVRFGQDEKVTGYSATQLIETSLISGHFAEMDNSAYINIFSCKDFDEVKAEEFCRNFFYAKGSKGTTTYRGVKDD